MHLATLLSTFYLTIAVLLWISVVAYDLTVHPKSDRLSLLERLRIALLIAIWPVTLAVLAVVHLLSLDANKKSLKLKTRW